MKSISTGQSNNRSFEEPRLPQEPVKISRTLTVVGLTSVVLAILKLIAFIMTGSVIVLSSMLDSFSDAVLSIANGIIHTSSRKSADQEHPFGHGGFEVLSSLIQGAVLFGFGVLVLAESLQRLVFYKAAERLNPEEIPMAIGVMLFAAVSGYLIQMYIKRARHAAEINGERSLSLNADSAHYESDAYMNLATAVGLAVVWYSGKSYYDAIFGSVGAVFLFRAGWPILKQSVRDILHAEADPVQQQAVTDIILGADERILGVHRLRVRTLGHALFVDFHMMLPHGLNLKEAHEIGDIVTGKIRSNYPGADVIFHLDPDTEPIDDHRWVKRDRNRPRA